MRSSDKQPYITSNGTQLWYRVSLVNIVMTTLGMERQLLPWDRPHRLDGPALINTDGSEYYFVNGKHYKDKLEWAVAVAEYKRRRWWRLS